MDSAKALIQDVNLKNDILSVLAYFDIFNYPLKEKEIRQYLNGYYPSVEYQDELASLTDKGIVFKHSKFYSLQPDYTIATRRKKGNQKARELMITARKVASFIAGFPFVRGVGISGSLSKNYADEYSDIDLFIITSKNKLWIARTLLHCFKKLTFLFNRQHLFCMNYFIEEEHLEIEEKNIFTAVEVATLIPLEGSEAFEKFYTANRWTMQFLPNKYLRISSENKLRQTWMKWLFEKFLDNPAGNLLDNMLMRITRSRWQKKTKAGKRNARGHVMEMCAEKFVAKPESENFQYEFLRQFHSKVYELVNKKVIVMKPAN